MLDLERDAGRAAAAPSPSQLTSDSSAAAQASASFGPTTTRCRVGLEADDVEPLAGRDREPAPLADREAQHAGVAPEHAAVDVHDLAGQRRVGAQPLDEARVAALAARSRCPGCRAWRRPAGRSAPPARGCAPWPARRAGSAGSPARRGSWRTGNSSGRGARSAAQCSSAPAAPSRAAHVVAGRQRVRRRDRGRSAAGP